MLEEVTAKQGAIGSLFKLRMITPVSPRAGVYVGVKVFAPDKTPNPVDVQNMSGMFAVAPTTVNV